MKPDNKDDIEAYKKLGRRYKRLRLKKGLSLEDVTAYGFSIKCYEQLEAGRSHTLTTLYKLAEMFEVKASKLLKGVWE